MVRWLMVVLRLLPLVLQACLVLVLAMVLLTWTMMMTTMRMATTRMMPQIVTTMTTMMMRCQGRPMPPRRTKTEISLAIHLRSATSCLYTFCFHATVPSVTSSFCS